jgi:hypothetical protein
MDKLLFIFINLKSLRRTASNRTKEYDRIIDQEVEREMEILLNIEDDAINDQKHDDDELVSSYITELDDINNFTFNDFIMEDVEYDPDDLDMLQ